MKYTMEQAFRGKGGRPAFGLVGLLLASIKLERKKRKKKKKCRSQR